MSEMASSTNIVVVDNDLEGQPRQPQPGQPGQPEAAATVLSKSGGPVPMALISWTSSDKANSSCVQVANEHETQLKNLTLVNILILVVLIIVFIANAKEGKESIFFFFLHLFLCLFGFLGNMEEYYCV